MRYDSPLIIMGGTRCGTTVLSRIIREHPQCFITMESLAYTENGFKEPFHSMIRDLISEFDSGLNHIEDKFGLTILNKKQRGRAKQFRKELSKMQFNSYEDLDLFWDIALDDKEFIYGDKLPEYIYHIEEILNHFPRAKFIMCIRDPRDVWISQTRAYYKYIDNPPFWASPSIKEAMDNDMIIERLEIWNKTQVNGIEIYYENLALNPRKELKKIIKLLEIDADELFKMYDKYFNARNIGSWRQYNMPLIPSEYQEIMKGFGYS